MGQRTLFQWPVRIYYEDTDAGGIVFYANYLKFFERARTEWLRSGGIDQSRLASSDGALFVVARTALDYHCPARLDQVLTLSVAIEKAGRASVDFIQQAWRNQDASDGRTATGAIPTGATAILVATGRIRVACVGAQDLRPRALPPAVLTFIRRSSLNLQPDATNVDV